MPPRIGLLDENVANQIAAGEVVERPASVVKELVENSLDAGARHVQIEVERGGKSLIRVTDDGCGMGPEDALLCLERHATSKIREAKDLLRLESFGFRGEALPSIASVSKFRLLTREASSVEGTEVRVDHGRIERVSAAGCPVGTQVEVRQIFGRVPARRKFLKADATEWGHIEQMVRVIALAHPEVGFCLSHDGRKVWQVPPVKERDARILAVMGAAWSGQTWAIKAVEGPMALEGRVGRPGVSRSGRQELQWFVNLRPVSHPVLNFALGEAYGGALPKGRYPVAALFLTLPMDWVDVNVHPAKREVRFQHELELRHFITRAVDETLRIHRTKSQVVVQVPLPASPLSLEAKRDEVSENPGPSVPPDSRPKSGHDFTVASVPSVPSESEAFSEVKVSAGSDSAAMIGATNPSSPRASTHDLRVVGMVLDSYVVAENSGGLVLIDVQAARERIIFEQALDRMVREEVVRQQLLLPVSVELTPSLAAFVEKNQQELIRCGVGVAFMGGTAFMVDAVPPYVESQDVEGFFRDLVEGLAEGRSASRSVRLQDEELAAVLARQTVRYLPRLVPERIEAFLDQLHECELPYTCPAGRPTMIMISSSELKRKFGRSLWS